MTSYSENQIKELVEGINYYLLFVEALHRFNSVRNYDKRFSEVVKAYRMAAKIYEIKRLPKEIERKLSHISSLETELKLQKSDK